MSRLADIRRLYELLSELEHRLGGARRLRDCDGRMGWPARGVYFFLDPSEARADSGSGARVVRVGTHATTEASRATLWIRLGQHRGTSRQPGGNHRGSVFRKIVGEAVAHRDGLNVRSWGHGNSAGAAAAHFGVPRENLVASSTWLGHHSQREHVRSSGLWNNEHVEDTYDPHLLERVDAMMSGKTLSAAGGVSKYELAASLAKHQAGGHR